MGRRDLLRPEEEEWQGVLEKLCERFPNFTPERIVNVLRENEGHAGQTAAALRDIGGDGVRVPDPDDVEHVRTLLSSPIMFNHACKDQFKKFDVNGDGVLEWKEVLQLVNTLYETFGLEPPKEGGLRTFFDATDEDGNGVLDEKEFKKFFSMFLQYAFFDFAQSQSDFLGKAKGKENRRGNAESSPKASHRHKETSPSTRKKKKDVTDSEPPAAASPEPAVRVSRTSSNDEQAADERADRTRRKGSRQSSQTRTPASNGAYAGGSPAGPVSFRCVASHGVTIRKSAEWSDRSDIVLGKGEQVQVLEQWIRTNQGWVPVIDKQGAVLMEVSRSGDGYPAPEEKSAVRFVDKSEADAEHVSRRAPREKDSRQSNKSGSPPQEVASGIDPSVEAEFRELYNNLCKRFPNVPPQKVAQVLSDTGGHAGRAAAALRDL